MHHQHHAHSRHIGSRYAQPLPVPDPVPAAIAFTPPTGVLLRRQDTSSSAASPSATKCGFGDFSGSCEKAGSGMDAAKIPIILGVTIPLVAALGLLFFLHRRNKRKLRQEDARDPHKSLDFGLDDVPGGRGPRSKKVAPGARVPEMTITEAEKEIRRGGKGLSMDMGNSPYLLPAGLHSSRESFHSLSRSMKDEEDPYRPVTFAKDGESVRKLKHDGSSIFTGSSGTYTMDAPQSNLLKNAQGMPKSIPPRMDSMSPKDATPSVKYPDPVQHRMSPPPKSPARGLVPATVDDSRDSYIDTYGHEVRRSNNYLGSFIHSREPSEEVAPKTIEQVKSQQPTVTVHPTLPELNFDGPAGSNGEQLRPQPRLRSMEASMHLDAAQNHMSKATFTSETSDYGEGFKVTPPSPKLGPTLAHPQPQRYSTQGPISVDSEQQQPAGLGVQNLDFNNRPLSMSLRPLPPDDPTEDPEQRANRIRSFYKEYFDESKPDPMPVQPAHADYYEDYGSEYLNGSVFDPQNGQYVVAQAPYAEPVYRRAMTPPPRAPPRFQSAGNYEARPRGSSLSSRAMARPGSPGAYSESGRSNYGRPVPATKKPYVPPAPLRSLPTPHMLKDDSNLVLMPIDFAPPTTFRDRQAGRRPDSPLGVQRPYSPSVRPHTPLASSFDDLGVMPSPHALRKSGTFTALDFAPVPRFKNADTGSDAGSIRSYRSGVSAVQMHSIRAGAYRVSRIPKGVVGTRFDLQDELRKPKWDLGY